MSFEGQTKILWEACKNYLREDREQMTKDKALYMSLDFIERVNKDGWLLADFETEMYAIIAAIKEALAQQEPVTWMVYTQDGQSVYVTDNPTDIQEGQRALPLYTAPPQRNGLTEQQIKQILSDSACWIGDDCSMPDLTYIIRAVEKVHGIGEK
jgi:hypothetical protein